MVGYLALEDGTVFKGNSFGAAGESVGEVVFNTSMSGYQEILTDPSYHRQIMACAWQGFDGYDAVSRITCCKPLTWNPSGCEEIINQTGEGPLVVALDFGVKKNILRILCNLGCTFTVFPASTSADEILSRRPDGVFLSNGPGDPTAAGYAVDTIRTLAGNLPIFGICLGHQLICLAFGGKTFKLAFGDRGANHPVKNLRSGKIEITSQNHGYCVDIDSLKDTGMEMTHVNLNDQTCEGIAFEKLRIMSVQYHPEASPGHRSELGVKAMQDYHVC